MAKINKRRPVVPELMGFAEVCAELDILTGNLQYVTDLPRPIAHAGLGKPEDEDYVPPTDWHVRATSLWLAEEIREFAQVYKARRAKRQAERELKAA